MSTNDSHWAGLNYSVKLAPELALIGSEVWVIGSPVGRGKYGRDFNSITKGIVTNIVTRDDALYYSTDAAVYFGNSGGAMFNKDLEIVGLASFLIVTHQGFKPAGFHFSVNTAVWSLWREYTAQEILISTPDFYIPFSDDN